MLAGVQGGCHEEQLAYREVVLTFSRCQEGCHEYQLVYREIVTITAGVQEGCDDNSWCTGRLRLQQLIYWLVVMDTSWCTGRPSLDTS
jgi:hypothetical protein